MKTFSKDKSYLQNKYMANLQQYKPAVKSIGLRKSLDDKDLQQYKSAVKSIGLRKSLDNKENELKPFPMCCVIVMRKKSWNNKLKTLKSL